jgi:orotate phosphoribosyltransferase
MAAFDQSALNRFLVDNDVIGFFPEGRTLKSGRFSYWYANCRNLASTVGRIDRTADFLLAFLETHRLQCDYVFGVPAGVTALATVVNYKRGMAGNAGHPVVIGREKPKEHGDPRDRYFIGPVKRGDRVVVLEDVTTTGGSMLKTLDALGEVGVGVAAVVAIVDRMEVRDDGRTVAQCVEQRGSRYLAMTSADQVIPLAVARYRPDRDFLQRFQQKYNEFAVKRIEVAAADEPR